MSTPETPALSELLIHTRWVEELARALVRDRSEADDVAQSALLLALRHQNAPRSDLRAWLGRVTRNLAREAGRREAQRDAIERRGARAEQLPSTEDLVGRAESERRLVEHVLALEEPHRSTLLLRYFEGLSPMDIARREGTSRSTVSSRITRAHARLRERFEKDGGERDWLASIAPILLPSIGNAAPAAEVSTMKWISSIAVGLVALGGVAWFFSRDTGARAEPLVVREAPAADVRAAEPTPATLDARRSAPATLVEKPAASAVSAEKTAVRDTYAKSGLGGRVFGTAYRPDGQPAANRRVRFLHQEGPEHFTTCDAAGRFEERKLKPGFYSVSTWPSKEELESIGIPLEGTTDGMKFLAQRSFDLDEGAEMQLELGALPRNPIHVRGRLLSNGASVGGMMQWIPALDDSLCRQKIAAVDEEHGYDVVLDEPGTWLCVIAPPEGGGRIEACVEIASAGDVRRDFVLADRGVRGRVRTEDGKPVRGASIELSVRGGVRQPLFLSSMAATRHSDEEGRFTIDHLEPGRYAAAVNSGKIEGDDALPAATLAHDVVVAESGYTELDVVVQRGVRVEITAIDEPATMGVAQIFLFDADGEPLNPFSGSRADKGGRAKIPALAPGRYSAVAAKMLRWSAPLEFEVVAGRPLEPMQLRIEPAARLTVDAPKLRDVWIDVRDERGRRFTPLLDFAAFNRAIGRDWNPERIELRVPAGNYRLVAVGKSRPEARSAVSVIAGDRARVTLER